MNPLRVRFALTCAAALALGGCVFVGGGRVRLPLPLRPTPRQRVPRRHPARCHDTGVGGRESRPAKQLAYLNDDRVLAAGNEVMRYLTVREQDTEVAFLFLFDIEVSEEEVKTLHIETCPSTTRKIGSSRSGWNDRSPAPTATTTSARAGTSP